MKSDKTHNSVTIIGAGLIGSLLASFLAKRGYSVNVFEKRTDPRNNLANRGRSIAMSLSHRGRKALNAIGLEEEVMRNTIAKHSRMVHLESGQVLKQQYSAEGDAIHTVNRRQLNISLIQKAESSGKVHFFFNHELRELNPDSLELTFYQNQIKKHIHRTASRVIAADGMFSKIVQVLQHKNICQFEHLTISHKYKEFMIAPNHKNFWALAENFVHVWPRQDFFFLALPTPDKKFTCTLFMKQSGPPGFNDIGSINQLESFFNSHFPNVFQLLEKPENSLQKNPVSDITTVKGGPWAYKNKILILGDAAHAIVPFYAMGMNVCFEDVTVFDELLMKLDGDISAVFEKYEQLRKKDTDAIADLSLTNFKNIEHSINADFHLKWKIERYLAQLFPNNWYPVYALIAFSSVPLSKIIRIKARQQAKINELMEKTPHLIKLSDEELINFLKDWAAKSVSTQETALPS